MTISGRCSQSDGMVKVGSDLWSWSCSTPLLKHGHLKQVAQDHVQMAFEYLQGWRFQSLCGQTVLMFFYPHSA